MLPIKSVRLINLIIPDKNYDIAIANDYYDFNSSDTLITLANGGGKSSLILLLSQVFQPNAKRGDRRLIDYVSDEGYSVISVELNDGKQLITLNLVARKKFFTESDKDTTEELSYFLFISEYEGHDALGHDPMTLPFFKDAYFKEQTPYEELEKLIKKQPEYFRYYKQRERGKYMAYLEDRFHNVKAWAETVWNINASEGGASSLFSNSKEDADRLVSSQKIICDHLIPMIESKNQMDAEAMKQQMEKIADLYANQYESQAKRNHLTQICDRLEDEFLKQTLTASELTANLNQATTTYENALEKLAPLTQYHETLMDQLAAQQKEGTKQLSEIDVLKQANTVKQLTQQVEMFTQTVEADETQLACLKETQTQTENDLTLQEATQKYEEYCLAKERVRLKEEAIETKRLNNQEKSLKITQLQQTLAMATQANHQKSEQAMTNLNEQLGTCEQTLEQLDQHHRLTYGELSTQKAQQTSLHHQLDELNVTIDQQWDTLGFEVREVERHETHLTQEQEALTQTFERLQDSLIKQVKEKEEASTELNQYLSNRTKLEATIQSRENELNQMKESRQRTLFQLSGLLEITLNPDISDREVQVHVREKESQWERETTALNKEVYLLEQSLTAKRGVVIPDELETWLHDQQIAYQQGIDYLNDCPSPEEQLRLIQSYPMMPYSLVLADPKDLERIKTCPIQLETNVFITLMKDPEHYFGQPDDSWWGIGSYDVEALNPEFWLNRREQLEQQLHEKKNRLRELKEQEIQLYRLQSSLDTHGQKKIAQRELALDGCFDELQKLNTKLHFQESVVGEIEQLLKDTEHKKVSTQQRLQEIEQQLKVLKDLALILIKQKELQTQKDVVQVSLIQTQQTLDQCQQELNEMKKQRQYLMLQREELNQTFFTTETYYSKYKHYLPDNPMTIESVVNIEELEQHLARLQMEIDLSQLEEELRQFTQAMDRAYQVFSEYGIDTTVCEATEYRATTVKYLKEQLKNLQTDILSVSNQYSVNQSKLNDYTQQLATEQQVLQAKNQTHAALYQADVEMKDLTNEELKTLEKFIKKTQQELGAKLTQTKEALSQLQMTLRVQSKQKQWGSKRLKTSFTTEELEQMVVSEYLQTLDEAQNDYNHQRDHLEDAIKDWNKALRKAWSMNSEILAALPKGLRHQKETLMDVTMENYLAVIEIHEKMVDRLKEAIKNEETKLQQADQQLQNFSEYVSIQCQEIYDQLQLFDRGLTIELNGKMEQILQLNVPLICSPEQFEPLIQEYVKTFIMDLARLKQTELAAGHATDEAEKNVRNKIKNFKLGVVLTAVIDFERTVLKVLKVSSLDYSLILWESDNSGGQGSLKALILIFAMFKYLNNGKNGTTILLDNPFGKMSTFGLVDVMFKTAKRLNIRLICFTAIEQTHIQNQFNVHYKLSHVKTKTPKVARMRVERQGETKATNQFERGFYLKEKLPTREMLQATLDLGDLNES